MECITQLWREKKLEVQFRELTHDFWIAYGLYKENTKFSVLISFYCIHWLFKGEKLHVMDFLMK